MRETCLFVSRRARESTRRLSPTPNQPVAGRSRRAIKLSFAGSAVLVAARECAGAEWKSRASGKAPKAELTWRSGEWK